MFVNAINSTVEEIFEKHKKEGRFYSDLLVDIYHFKQTVRLDNDFESLPHKRSAEDPR